MFDQFTDYNDVENEEAISAHLRMKRRRMLIECRGEEDSENDGEQDSESDIREFRHRVIDECNEDLQSCNDCGEDGEGALISGNKVHNLKVNTMQENAN